MAAPSQITYFDREIYPGETELHSGLVWLVWNAPNNGGSAITSYRVEWATNSSFTANLDGANVEPGEREFTARNLLFGVRWYFRIRAENPDNGPWSSTIFYDVPASTALDNVQSAMAVLSDGAYVELRNSGASGGTLPVVTLGYREPGSSTWNQIATVTNATHPLSDSSRLAPTGGARAIALVLDPAGNIYLIGRQNDVLSTVMVVKYPRTGTRTWGAPVTDTQALASAAGRILRHFAAVWVPAASRIFMLTKRAGETYPDAISYAVIDPAAIGTSSPLFTSSGSTPSWLPLEPGGQDDTGTLDVAMLSNNRVAILANGGAVVDISSSGVITGVSKSPNYTSISGQWGRALPISSSSFVTVGVYMNSSDVVGEMRILHRNAADMSTLSSETLGSTFTPASAPTRWGLLWDAYYDAVAGVVRVYYALSGAGNIGKIGMFTYSPSADVSVDHGVQVTLATGGAAITAIRVGRDALDERRVAVQAETTSGSTYTIWTHSSTVGNVAPTAPNLVDVVGFDATSARTFSWTFGDPNPKDTTPAGGTFRIERVSDSVQVYTAALGAGVTSLVLPAGTLTNGVTYRWQVRHTDTLGAVGAYSAFDEFTTTSAGTLTITSPATDNPAGYEESDVTVAWTFTATGYSQAAYRVRVLNHSTSAVVSDTGTIASSATSRLVSGLLTDVEQRIEVTVTSTAPGAPTVTATRLITPSFALPMTPTIAVEVGETSITVLVTNPAPTGDRPQVTANIIERRRAGSGDFEALGMTGVDGTYDDFAVASATAYEYRARGVTT